MAPISLTNRLLSVAKHVRQGAVLADVGTDHGYLPIFLLQSGKIERAICADINQAPLSSAYKNACEHGVCDKLEFLLSDGFCAFSSHRFTDAAVCGMGGELILDIVSRAVDMLKDGVNLILQPMSRQATLRRGLYALGFEVACEEYCADKGKYYQTLLVRYTGICEQLSELDSELGKDSTRGELNDAKRGYLLARRRGIVKSIKGLRHCGGDTEEKEKILSEIDKILNLRGT